MVASMRVQLLPSIRILGTWLLAVAILLPLALIAESSGSGAYYISSGQLGIAFRDLFATVLLAGVPLCAAYYAVATNETQPAAFVQQRVNQFTLVASVVMVLLVLWVRAPDSHRSDGIGWLALVILGIPLLLVLVFLGRLAIGWYVSSVRTFPERRRVAHRVLLGVFLLLALGALAIIIGSAPT